MWVELHMQLKGKKFFNLPTELNCQYWMPQYWEILPNAKIIHLAACPNQARLELASEYVKW
jgi:hypothetical protein